MNVRRAGGGIIYSLTAYRFEVLVILLFLPFSLLFFASTTEKLFSSVIMTTHKKLTALCALGSLLDDVGINLFFVSLISLQWKFRYDVVLSATAAISNVNKRNGFERLSQRRSEAVDGDAKLPPHIAEPAEQRWPAECHSISSEFNAHSPASGRE